MLLDEEWIQQRLLNTAAPTLPFGETIDKHAAGYKELFEAISLVPNELKSSFQDAICRCPNLVETESDPIRFLRREDFNGWAGALRLMEYWTTRNNVFGDRAFLPLLSAPGGALDAEDLQLLSTGFEATLPRDRNGRMVTLIDRSDKTDTLSAKGAERINFLINQLQSQHPLSQREGVVFVAILPGIGTPPAIFKPLEVVSKAFPVRIHSIYLTHRLDETDKQSFLNDILPNALKHIGHYFKNLSVSVAADSEHELLRAMESYGFERSGLPPCLGGMWNKNVWLETMGIAVNSPSSSEASRYEKSDLQGAVALVELFHTDQSSNVPVDSHYDKIVLIDQLHDALALILEDEKSAFLEAMETAPHVFKSESDPLLFLRCEKYDPWAAAKRITNYWTKRKELFGERAFLPLTLSGKGALSDEDISIFKSCFAVQLPDSEEGQSVVCFNRSMAPRGLSIESRWRALFYLSHVFSGNDTTVRDGVISLHIMTQPSTRQAPAVVAGAVDLMKYALPTLVHSYHFICMRPRSNVAAYFANWFRTIQYFLKNQFLGKIHVHVADTGLEVLSKLEPFGITSSGIPESIGGTWSYSNGLLWVQQRLSDEELSAPTEPFWSASKQASKSRRIDAADETLSSDVGVSSKRLRLSSDRYLDDDVYPEGFVESESVTCKGLEQMEQAIADLPDEDKAVLLEARREVPLLVEKETPMLRFLRYEKYNSWAAARRLATYWKNRKLVFGSRCFLPMNQTGEGTLTRDDLASLGTGYFSFLKYDSSGRSILLYDSSRRVNHSRETRLRCSFYIWGILAENEMSQEEGYVSLSVLSRPTLDRTLKECIDLVEQSIPARACVSHIVNCPSVSEGSSFLNTMVPLLLQLMGPFLKEKTHVHVGDTRAKLADILVSCGFEKESLPKCVGGSWGYEMFSQWQESRLRYEWELPPNSTPYDQPHIPDYQLKPITDMTEDEKIERKRRMNVLHSRRRRERQRVEMEVFAEQAADLREKNWNLQQENSKLEVMLRGARAKVMRLEQMQPLRGVQATTAARAPVLPPVPSQRQPSNSSLFTHATRDSVSSLEHFTLPQHFIERELAKKAQRPWNGGFVPNNLIEASIIEQHIRSEQQRQQRLLAAQIMQSGNLPMAVSSSNFVDQMREPEFTRQGLDMNADPNEPQGFISNLLGLPWWFNS